MPFSLGRRALLHQFDASSIPGCRSEPAFLFHGLFRHQISCSIAILCRYRSKIASDTRILSHAPLKYHKKQMVEMTSINLKKLPKSRNEKVALYHLKSLPLTAQGPARCVVPVCEPASRPEGEYLHRPVSPRPFWFSPDAEDPRQNLLCLHFAMEFCYSRCL